MTKVTKEQHEALHVLGKALNDAKKTAFRYDHTRPNAEINAEIDAAVEAELSRDKLYGYIRKHCEGLTAPEIYEVLQCVQSDEPPDELMDRLKTIVNSPLNKN